MKCPKCSHLNEDEARYCNNCGFPLMEKKKDWTSILLLAWCVSLLFFTLVWSILNYVRGWAVSEYDPRTVIKIIDIIWIVVSFVQKLTYLVIPFAIPKIGFKIAAFVIVIIYIIYGLGQNIYYFLNPISYTL